MDQRSPGTFESFSSGKGAMSMPRPLQHFYKGEPMALGITQILTGLLHIAFGAVLDNTRPRGFYDVIFKTPIWTGCLYIISGSLSVAAAKNPKMPLVKGALGMNIVSAVAAGIVIVISSISMVFERSPWRAHSCAYGSNDTQLLQICYKVLTIPYLTVYGTVAILLVFTILEFFIAIVSSVFGCGSMCRSAFRETTIVIFQNTVEASPPPPPAP